MASQIIRAHGSLDGVLKDGPCKFFGYDILVVTATGPINLRDGGASGTIRCVIPSGTAAGAMQNRATPIHFQTNLYIEFASSATGTVGVLVE